MSRRERMSRGDDERRAARNERRAKRATTRKAFAASCQVMARTRPYVHEKEERNGALFAPKGAGRKVLRLLARAVLAAPDLTKRAEALVAFHNARNMHARGTAYGVHQRRLRGSLSGPEYVAACRLRDEGWQQMARDSASIVSSPETDVMSSDSAFMNNEQLARKDT